MKEEEKLLSGKLFCPGHPDLRAIKLRCHNLCSRYNSTLENETEARAALVKEIFAEVGEGSFFQGPIAIHYGSHTHIGKRFFGNFNLSIMDDAQVTIGDDCNFGPNVTIVTAVHPLLAEERRAVTNVRGEKVRVCYGEPVTVGSDCWFGANVVVCPGVTIGDGCVIGAGSVVTRDVPANSVAVGNPARVLRTLGPADRIGLQTQVLGEEFANLAEESE